MDLLMHAADDEHSKLIPLPDYPKEGFLHLFLFL